MLEDLLNLHRQFAITRHREAPLLHEREIFLEHLHRQGTSLAALRGVSWQLLNVIAQYGKRSMPNIKGCFQPLLNQMRVCLPRN